MLQNIPLKYYLIKKRRFFRRLLEKIAQNRWLTFIFPPVTSAYYAVLDILKDDLPIIKNHLALHQRLFWIILVVSLLLLFIQGFVEEKESDKQKIALTLLTDFLATVGRIVQNKLDRFRKKFPQLKPSSNKFNQITQPNEQLSIIARESVAFLQKAYGLNDDQINITIARKKGENGKWHYCYRYQNNWKHSDPKKILPQKMAIVDKVNRGEYCFFPDKIKAAKEGEYCLSKRDRDRLLGSAFLFPVKFEGNQCAFEYLISIITYGKQFCEEDDQPSIEVSQIFLREISRRFEIELCLKSIKECHK